MTYCVCAGVFLLGSGHGLCILPLNNFSGSEPLLQFRGESNPAQDELALLNRICTIINLNLRIFFDRCAASVRLLT